MTDPLTLTYSQYEIDLKRAEISRRFTADSPNVKTPDITRIAGTDIRLLFDLYDEVFLNH